MYHRHKEREIMYVCLTRFFLIVRPSVRRWMLGSSSCCCCCCCEGLCWDWQKCTRPHSQHNNNNTLCVYGVHAVAKVFVCVHRIEVSSSIKVSTGDIKYIYIVSKCFVHSFTSSTSTLYRDAPRHINLVQCALFSRNICFVYIT